MTQYFDLKPLPGQNQRSFYGKAQVRINDDMSQDLFSYNTLICTKNPDGTITKHYDDWTQTTGRHIKAFTGLSKKQYSELV